MNFRIGNMEDLEQLKELGVASWTEFRKDLTNENWNGLNNSLNDFNTYSELLQRSECIVCQDNIGKIIGMAFLVPSGNPNEIYKEEWCHLRFVSVHPNVRGKGIGKKLTEICIDLAKKNNEKIMALHTSEIMESARHIYEKMGFKIFKEIEPRLGVKYWLYTIELNE